MQHPPNMFGENPVFSLVPLTVRQAKLNLASTSVISETDAGLLTGSSTFEATLQNWIRKSKSEIKSKITMNNKLYKDNKDNTILFHF